MKAIAFLASIPLTVFGGFWVQFGVVVLITFGLIIGVFLLQRRQDQRSRDTRPARRRRRRRTAPVAPLPERVEITPATVQIPVVVRAQAAPVPVIVPPPVLTPAEPIAEPVVAEVESSQPEERAIADPLRHWGLREPAFDNAPTARFLYLAPEHAEALFRLRYAIHHRKGCALLTGMHGCGKTTLTRALVRELDPKRFDVALIANPRTTPIELLQELLYQLGTPTTADDKPTLMRALERRLVENLKAGRDTVVIVDEAQLIEDEAVFNELRLLLNFQTNDRFLVTLVLAGSPELLGTLRRHPHLAQRCVVRASLEPLDREQTGHYVRHRLATAGCEAEAMTESAVDEVYTATGGTPRVINNVCDLTLFVGAAAGVRHVEADLVRRVAEDLVPV